MARGRMLNKTICVSSKIDQLSNDTCRLLATWTIAHLDKRGVYHGHPAVVKSYVFPRRTDVTNEDVEGYLNEMEAVGLIVRFRARGDQWMCWPGFDHNQVGLRGDRERTDFPPPPASPASPGPGKPPAPPGRGDEDPGDGGTEERGEARRKPPGSAPDARRNVSGGMPAEEKSNRSESDGKEAKGSPPRARARGPDSEDQDHHNGNSDNAGENAGENAFTVYQRAGGVLSPLLTDELGDLIDEYEVHRQSLPPPAAGADRTGDEWVQAAIREMTVAGVRISVKYVEAILDRWRREGFRAPFSGRKRGNNGGHYEHRPASPGVESADAPGNHSTPSDAEIHRRRIAFARHDLEAGKRNSPYYQYLPDDERPGARNGL